MTKRHGVVTTSAFGNPDGRLSPLDDLMKGYVPFDHQDMDRGLTSVKVDLAPRILIGPKGSGKTVLLRRMQAQARQDESLYVEDVQFDPPRPEVVTNFARLYPSGERVERWSIAWKCALLRAICSRLCAPPHRDRMPAELLLAIEGFPRHVVPARRTPVSIYNELEALLDHHSLQSLLRGPDYVELEEIVSRAVSHMPPMFFFLDALDEWWEKAPQQMLDCQLGLFRTTLHLLQERRLGGRIHLCVAFRSEVWSAVSESEHFDRIKGDRHIRNLTWSRSAIEWFLNQKVERLPQELLCSPHASDPMERWLGHARVNGLRSKQRLSDYLIDHTRMLPRDIVRLGNALCDSVPKGRDSGSPTTATIRRCVSEVARDIGQGQLRVCATELATTQTAPGSYSDDEAIGLVPHNFEKLSSLLLSLGSSEFPREGIDAMIQGARDGGLPADFGSILWRHGILGVRGKRDGRLTSRFYGHGDESRDLPLRPGSSYVLHPSVSSYLGLTRKRSTATSTVRPAAQSVAERPIDRPTPRALPCVVFIYSHEDAAQKKEIEKHLRVFAGQRRFEIWSDADILPGAAWERSILAALASASAVVLIITASFFNRDFIRDTEIPEILRLHAAGRLLVVPVIAKDCGWRDHPWLSEFQAITRKGEGSALWTVHSPTEAELSEACRAISKAVGKRIEFGQADCAE